MVARRNLFLMAAALEPELNPAALRYGRKIKPWQKAAMPPPITDFDTLLNTELLTVSSSSETWPGPGRRAGDEIAMKYITMQSFAGRGDGGCCHMAAQIPKGLSSSVLERVGLQLLRRNAPLPAPASDLILAVMAARSSL